MNLVDYEDVETDIKILGKGQIIVQKAQE